MKGSATEEMYEEFLDKIAMQGLTEEIYFIRREMRLKETPILEYGKTWKGDTFTIEKFLDLCKNDINNYFNNDEYPLLNVSIATEVYTHLKDNINEENSAINSNTVKYK